MKKLSLAFLSCVLLIACVASRSFSEQADATQPTPTEKRLSESLDSLRGEVKVMRDREVIVQENLTESRAQVDRALDLNSNVVGWIKVWTWFLGAVLGISSATVGYLFFKDKKLSELIRKADESAKSITEMRDEARQKMDDLRQNLPTLTVDIDMDRVAEDRPSEEKLREVLTRFIVFETIGGKLTVDNLSNRATAYYYLGEYQSALDAVEQALKLDPNDATIWTRKGVALLCLNQYDKALAAYEQALRFKPDFAKAWHNKGATFGILGRPEDALFAFEQALKFKPDYAIAWYGKACVYSLNKDKVNALPALKIAINLDTKYREMAKTDNAFEWLWDDPEFIAIIGKDNGERSGEDSSE